MPKSTEMTPDAESPEWTKEDFATALRFKDLPKEMQRALARNTRGPQKAAKKVPVSIRLSTDVVEGLRAMGDGWQTRANDALRDWIKHQPKRVK